MEIELEKYQEMLVHEAFISRAARVDMPFMLKGSYVTRQYFDNPADRIPADLDWFYLERINDPEKARTVFSEWVTRITEIELDDNVHFTSFTKNAFWRLIDYAMADDFPTVNTDLEYTIDGSTKEFSLDISFNLPIGQQPVSLQYKPLTGESFLLPKTVPLSLQVSWKIHQTLVRPRFKDIFDLIYLVQHPTFDEATLEEAIRELMEECKHDKGWQRKFHYFLSYQIGKLYPKDTIADNWAYWRYNINLNNYQNILQYGDRAERITDVKKLPEQLIVFLEYFKHVMESRGFTAGLIKDLEIQAVPANEEEDEKKKAQLAIQQENWQRATEQTSPVWKWIKKWFR